MTEQVTDFIQIPGVPPSDRWGGWDSTVELPKRRVNLPIEMRVARNREAILWFGVFVAVPFTFLVFLVLWMDIETFASYGYCASKNAAHHTGVGCIPNFLIIAIFLSFLLHGFYRIADAIILARNSKVYEAPHIRIDKNTSWHFQLAEPIRFEDVAEIVDHYGEVCVKCVAAPKLAFWNWSNRGLWSGKNAKFYFPPTLFAPSFWVPRPNSELIDAIIFLAKDHRRPTSPAPLSPTVDEAAK
jgi:hypothetical protein